MRDELANNWTRGSKISTEVLESLRELNHRFLDLLGAPVGDRRFANCVGLSMETCDRLAPLSADQKSALSACPYALFDLGLDDAGKWRTRLESTMRWNVCDQARAEPSTVEFVRSALFFSWHVAVTSRLTARLLLGMSEETTGLFRGLTIDCVSALATEAVPVTARWRDCPTYWAALTDGAGRTNAAFLRRVQLSGLQLAAATHLT